MRRYSRMVMVLAMAAGMVFLVSARCVENDALRRGPDGNWHVYGELFNETDVQGAQMLVQGTLFDASGRVLASATAPTCPQELSPGKPLVYDIIFLNTQGIPQPASHKVNVASGTALQGPLSQLNIQPTFEVKALPGNTVGITAAFQASPQHSGTYGFCMAFYDGTGKVVLGGPMGSTSGEFISFQTPISRSQIPGATSVRVWIVAWPDSAAITGFGESQFQAFVSGKIALPFNPVVGATPQIGF